MSDGASAETARVIAEFVTQMSDHTKGVLIMTHSRLMVPALSQGLRPHYIHLGTDPAEAPPTIEHGLAHDTVPISPQEVRKNLARFRAIQEILNEKRK